MTIVVKFEAHDLISARFPSVDTLERGNRVPVEKPHILKAAGLVAGLQMPRGAH